MNTKSQFQVTMINLLRSAKGLRARRMKAFLDLVKPPKDAKIIDLGGTAAVWELVKDCNFEITLVNLPSNQDSTDHSNCRLVYADACDLRGLFKDKSFDVVFSNSVIEHVGDALRQQAFSREVYRLADAYWIQTPDPLFPIEAHTGVPFYWQRSEQSRQKLLHQWEENLPVWANMVRETRAISRKQLQQLFPDSAFYTERVLGLPKSVAAYRPCAIQSSKRQLAEKTLL